MYIVILEPAAQRDLRKLSKLLHGRILKALRQLEANPHHRSVKRLVGFETQWRVRVGEYRVLYEIADDRREVHVYRIVPRSEAYR